MQLLLIHDKVYCEVNGHELEQDATFNHGSYYNGYNDIQYNCCLLLLIFALKRSDKVYNYFRSYTTIRESFPAPVTANKVLRNTPIPACHPRPEYKPQQHNEHAVVGSDSCNERRPAVAPAPYLLTSDPGAEHAALAIEHN